MPPNVPDYSAVPLWRKLGVKEGSRVRIVGRPTSVDELAALPTGAVRAHTDDDVILLFATRMARLRSEFPRLLQSLADRGGLWISWPKKSSLVAHDLDFDQVQRVGLASGLVDNKICRIDDDWQAMRFVRRVAR